MKCYYHFDSDAVAICKNCSRGLCQECAADVGNGIACKGRCEAEVRAIVEIIEKNKSVYQKTSSAYSINALVYALLSVPVLFFGFVIVRRSPALGYFLLMFGGVCLLGAGLTYSAGRKFVKK